MNYNIINDKNELLKFIEWLPELEEDEKYYVSLLARNKYSSIKLNKDKAALKRFLSNKEFLFDKIKQLEIEFGGYKYDRIDIPQDALALYITPNPRSLEKATHNIILELMRKSWKDYDGYNPISISLSEVQKSNGKVTYFDFDFDVQREQVRTTHEEILKCINIDACTFVTTRGGFHLLVDINKIDSKYKKTWNSKIQKIHGCDVRGTSNLLPVPGCVQGNYVPKMSKFE